MLNVNRYVSGQWLNAFTLAVVSTGTQANFGVTVNGLAISVNGSGSVPSTGATITGYSWNFGDASTFGTGATTNHTYTLAGTYTVTLTVTDSLGGTSSTSHPAIVKSTAVEYLADDTPLFNLLVHPASPTAVAQCIIQSPDTDQWFMSQVHPETVAASGDTDSTRISRMTPDGTLIDQMLCTYGGHGTSMGLEYSNGQIFIWLTYHVPAAGSTVTNDIVRFPYTPGTFARSQIAGLQVKIPGGVYRRIQFDWKNGYAILTEDPNWTRYRISDILAGITTNPLNTITLTVNPPTLQGICTYGDSAFYYTGDGADTRAQSLTNAGGPFTMYEVSWKTGTRVKKVDLSSMLLDASGTYVDGHIEPEGCSIYDPGTGLDPVLNFGLISSAPGTNHTYYVYQFDLVNQAEALAGRAFALRDTKPTAANVGAGILRPVTAVHNGDLVITTADSVLKDTQVNGSVTVAAVNVVIENCIIRGPAADPGSATVNPVFVVNTDNAAAAAGPALIRYSTITGTWRSPNVYGVGNRNYTLEYCDISKVVEGVRATADVTGGDASAVIRGNYIHDLIFFSPDPTNPTNVGATNIAGEALTGTYAGKNWDWASGIHLLNNNSTGIDIYGNNIVANWSSDPAVSSTPLPPAYARLNAVRITAGANILVEDNWLDGGEFCFYSPGTATTGSIARNRFGRGMSHTSTADSGYYALAVLGSTFDSHDADSVNRNVWADTGNTVIHRTDITPTPPPNATIPLWDHVVVVIMENHTANSVISNGGYMTDLANANAYMTQSFATTHPSLPNYLAIWSGSDQGVTDDGRYDFASTINHLGKQMAGAGKTFKGYSEDLPSVGYLGDTSANYARKHAPWVSWQANGGFSGTLHVPFTQWPTDFTTLPKLSFVIPNLINDVHDAGISTGNAWLLAHIDPYVQWAKTHNSLLILTFDEDDETANNLIYTVFAGQHVKPGQYPQTINHYSILGLLQDWLVLPRIAGSVGKAQIITPWN